MKTEIDRSLFWFELKALLLNKLTLFQTALVQFYCARAFLGKGGPQGCDAIFWANYGLFVCTAFAFMAGAVCVGYVLVKPRTNGMLELMLVSPLSAPKLAFTSFAVCALFSAANLALHLALVWLRYGVVPQGAGFWLALPAAAGTALLVLLGSVIFALRSNDVSQLHSVLLILGMLLWAAAFMTGMRLQVPAWVPLSLLAVSALGIAAMTYKLPRLVSRERAVLV